MFPNGKGTYSLNHIHSGAKETIPTFQKSTKQNPVVNEMRLRALVIGTSIVKKYSQFQTSKYNTYTCMTVQIHEGSKNSFFGVIFGHNLWNWNKIIMKFKNL